VPACPCGSGSHLLARSSSGAVVCPRGSGSHLSARGSSRAAMCPCGSGSHLPAQGGSGATICRLDSSTRLLAQGNSRAITCPEDGLYKLQPIKQISLGDMAIMIFIGARARVSSKALHDKGCSAHLQGVQQTAH
jgi:hypothetical protein